MGYGLPCKGLINEPVGAFVHLARDPGKLPSLEVVEGFLDFFAEHFGPLVTAKQMLGSRFEELRAEILAIWERRNTSGDGGLQLPQEYLLSVIRL